MLPIFERHIKNMKVINLPSFPNLTFSISSSSCSEFLSSGDPDRGDPKRKKKINNKNNIPATS